MGNYSDMYRAPVRTLHEIAHDQGQSALGAGATVDLWTFCIMPGQSGIWDGATSPAPGPLLTMAIASSAAAGAGVTLQLQWVNAGAGYLPMYQEIFAAAGGVAGTLVNKYVPACWKLRALITNNTGAPITYTYAVTFYSGG